MIKRTVMAIASLLAIIASSASIYETPTFIGLALGASLAFVILLLGNVVCWIVDFFQKPEMKTSKDDPL